MDYIFPQFPKDIRRLLWNSYLNELDRKMVFLSFSPKTRFRNLTKLAATLGDSKVLSWILQQGYILSRNDRKKIIERDNLEIIQELTFDPSSMIFAAKCGAINILKWGYENNCIDYLVDQNVIQHAIWFERLEICIYRCKSYSILKKMCLNIGNLEFRKKLVQSFSVSDSFFKLPFADARFLYGAGIRISDEYCEKARKFWGEEWVPQ